MLDKRGLLIYHHGTPVAGPMQQDLLAAARANNLQAVEVVRPGYGSSTRQVGRSVADIVPSVVELADHLGHETFATLGWSGVGPTRSRRWPSPADDVGPQ